MHNEINKYPYEPQDPWTKVPKTTPWKNPGALEKPKVTTIADVFPRLDRLAIGFDDMLALLKETTYDTKPSAYPPYNITKFKGGKWQIEMALAGFRKEDIEIKVEDRTLTISSEVIENDNPKHGEVIHHGIAQRDFTTKFAMAEYVEVESAKMEDGILVITLVTNIPEEKKPKVIDIQ